MKTEVLVLEKTYDDIDMQQGYKDVRMIFKKMQASQRSDYCTDAISEFASHPEWDEDNYIKGMMSAIDDEMTNLVENGLYV